jgi:hypothetical protein
MSSIGDALGADHERLGAIFDRVREEVAGLDEGAAGSLETLERDLLRHIEWEERALFPALLRGVPGDHRRHVDSLTADHDLIREHLAKSRQHLAARRFVEAGEELQELAWRLKGHNDDEEYGCYRDADRYLPEEERARLLELYECHP